MRFSNFLILAAVAITSQPANPFQKSVATIRDTFDDEALVTEMIDNSEEHLYHQPSSSLYDYALLATYVLFCKNEDASEGIGDNIHNMLVQYPDKWYEMKKYWDMLPASQQEVIEKYLVRIILFGYFYVDRNFSKKDFHLQYPYVDLKKRYFEEMKENEDVYDYLLRENVLCP